MKEELFNQDFAFWTIKDLKSEYKRLIELEKETGEFVSQELWDIETELRLRKEYLKQTKGAKE